MKGDTKSCPMALRCCYHYAVRGFSTSMRVPDQQVLLHYTLLVVQERYVVGLVVRGACCAA